MSEIKIEKAVSLPASARGRTQGTYPWRTMAVGDSFLAPPDRSRRTIAAAAANTGKRIGAKFATRKTPEGVRVWRVS